MRALVPIRVNQQIVLNRHREIDKTRIVPGRVKQQRRRWQPPEGLMPDDIRRIIAAATTQRDALLMRACWATGGRISEVLALRVRDIARDHLVLRTAKNPNAAVRRIFLPNSDRDLPGELLLWAREQCLAENDPIFVSRQRSRDGIRRAITRQQAWEIVKRASERAGVLVLAQRASRDGLIGDPAPVHPHLFRHSRVRATLRQTRSLPLVQRMAGWSRLNLEYLTIGDAEAAAMMAEVED